MGVLKLNNIFDITIQISSSNETFSLPLESGGTYDFFVLWGDGQTDKITAYNDAEVTHTYLAPGTYRIQIMGTIYGWNLGNSSDKTKLYIIDNWGPIRIGSGNSHFYGCGNLIINATNLFDLTNTTTFHRTFNDCTSLTTIDTSAWNTSSVVSFYRMFYNCTSLITIDTSAWNTSSVSTFYRMFYSCTSLTTIDTSAWNTSSVVSFLAMFSYCTSLTTIDTSAWNITSMTDATDMFFGVTLTTATYDELLVAWESQAVNNNVSFHGGGSKYSAGAPAAARAALIADHSWTITDGGQV